MYEVRMIGAIKGMENHMEGELHEELEELLTKAFKSFGVFEIFVLEVEERMVGEKIGQ